MNDERLFFILTENARREKAEDTHAISSLRRALRRVTVMKIFMSLTKHYSNLTYLFTVKAHHNPVIFQVVKIILKTYTQNLSRQDVLHFYVLHFQQTRFFEVLLVHGQVTIIFVVSVGLSVCLFVQSFSQPSLIRFRSD